MGSYCSWMWRPRGHERVRESYVMHFVQHKHGDRHLSYRPSVDVVVVVFTLNRSFYSATSAVPPVSFPTLHPREVQTMWSDRETQKNQTPKNQGRPIK